MIAEHSGPQIGGAVYEHGHAAALRKDIEQRAGPLECGEAVGEHWEEEHDRERDDQETPHSGSAVEYMPARPASRH
eukprot:CAMPEP_0173181934 /NCGR_PEP_ID=MMETSP1141-20130122/7555_1 /TAXON_ID=483371 /ORGANISM="non described non described, Strain CCMP2298" /LENGTH=75 /DNA_ID=CAMNT_0014104967 /DNA_START=294 /DNA_END=521 /DNA_ORIENTATION=+